MLVTILKMVGVFYMVKKISILFSILFLTIISLFIPNDINKTEASNLEPGIVLDNLIEDPGSTKFKRNYVYVPDDDLSYSYDFMVASYQNTSLVVKYESNIKIYANHNYYLYFDYCIENDGDFNLIINEKDINIDSQSVTDYFGDIIKLDDSNTLKVKFYIDSGVAYFRNIHLIDLTATFGDVDFIETNILSDVDTYFYMHPYYHDQLLIDDSYIFGPSTLFVDCTEKLTDDKILSYYVVDGYNLHLSINNYTNNEKYPGTYSVQLAYHNLISARITKDILIKVRDNESPVISLKNGSNTINVTVSNPMSIAEIKNQVIVTDNSDNFLISKLQVNASNYLNNQSTPGVYWVDLTVSDYSNNTTTTRIYINVVNDLGPIFDAPTTIVKSTDIVFNTTDVLNTILSITSQDGVNIPLFINDAINSENIKIIKDTFTGNANKPGTYVITLLATDNNDRSSYHTFTIKVLKNIPDVVMYNDTIYVGYDVILSNNDIVNLLNKADFTKLNTDNSVISFPINEYELYGYAAGQIYTLKIRFICANGTEEVYYINIDVSNNESMIIETGLWADIKRFYYKNDVWIIPCVFLLLAFGIFIVLKEKGFINTRW